jgi:L-fuculokinase
MTTIAVLDIGKTNVKVVQFDRSGAELAARSLPNRPLDTPPYLHADVAAIWSFALDALAELNRGRPIADIVVTTHGASGAVVGDDPDRDDGLMLPLLDYESPLPETVAARYQAIRPPFGETFSPSLPLGLLLGRQFAALQWLEPDRFARATALLMQPQYWAWRLSGVMASEVTSLGCHTDLWRPAEGCFSSLVEAMGWRSLLPPLRAAHDTLAAIRPELAARTGLDPATRIRCGIHDSNASLLPHLVGRTPPFTVISTGTWVIVMAVGGDTARLDPEADMLANVTATGQALACARFMGGREFALIAGDAPARADAAAVAAVIAADLFALPSFAETGGPFVGRPGRLTGQPATPAGRTALAALYAALMTDDGLDRLGVSGDLIIEGGLTRTPAYAAILAALRPKDRILIADTASGTAQGAALLAVWPEGFADHAEPGPAPVWSLPGLAAYRDRWRRHIA